ncbi:ankyrin repeat domain-containing protein 34A [Rhinatrema bivittatum]|uniref:ankyrin repeat domain-containing protein 34A n=1 Tax=Rhinatrema bivittatum TaxID=194408 RepID=UPI00112C3768|nr:ankyrin repeat domain-containing protein 34A [Rhinatrema bivittatum]XP_029437453.1 ankyrin repeat domain-containing protein 34A [Rhinatrema bivittatum]XP_029437454.1 ankyrin repeat domain-containing protein 34A [Rhinatrema bivittatum]XP_029437455.1 ankyrin repeat domain-containing protein 34A [Rhinatrema bivittatum]
MLHTEGSALLKAVWQGKFRLTRLLLEGGAYINEGNAQGETPLMAACLGKYDDPQNKPRMVKYLLENGADPNIPDKAGKTALMHACSDRAGVGVVSVLLEHAADPSMKDYSGSSALVYAINRGDRETLQVLLDACKAKGKEVIIITTDTSPSGTKKTKQYLNSPPSPGIDDKHSPALCMSPSDIEIKTSLSPASEKEEERDVFNFNMGTRLTCPSSSKQEMELASEHLHPKGRVVNMKQLKRLNSEPWGLVAPSVLSGSHSAGTPEKLTAVNAEEKITAELNGLTISKRPLLSRRHSIEGQDPSCFKMATHASAEDALIPETSWAEKVQFSHLHQPLSRRNTAPEAQETSSATLAPTTGAGLRGVPHHKLTRMDHYESDSHLCPDSIPGSPDSGRVSLERRKFNASPLTLFTSSSRESLESIPSAVSPMSVRRRTPGLLERRGSGTHLLDHISHTRPGFLPPLNVNPNPPIPDIRSNGKPSSPIHGSQKTLLPMAPNSPKHFDAKAKKKLVRRHSMQTEQIKQLTNFQNLLVHNDSVN